MGNFWHKPGRGLFCAQRVIGKMAKEKKHGNKDGGGLDGKAKPIAKTEQGTLVRAVRKIGSNDQVSKGDLADVIEELPKSRNVTTKTIAKVEKGGVVRVRTAKLIVEGLNKLLHDASPPALGSEERLSFRDLFEERDNERAVARSAPRGPEEAVEHAFKDLIARVKAASAKPAASPVAQGAE